VVQCCMTESKTSLSCYRVLCHPCFELNFARYLQCNVNSSHLQYRRGCVVPLFPLLSLPCPQQGQTHLPTAGRKQMRHYSHHTSTTDRRTWETDGHLYTTRIGTCFPWQHLDYAVVDRTIKSWPALGQLLQTIFRYGPSFVMVISLPAKASN